jgi:hypothetical protein
MSDRYKNENTGKGVDENSYKATKGEILKIYINSESDNKGYTFKPS